MKQKTLTHPKACAICGAAMETGQPFAWHKVTRATIGNKVGGSYSLLEVECFVPKHTYNCFQAKIDAEKRERAILTAQYAKEHGATEAEISAILAG